MGRHKETLTFNSFSGYYGSIPAGYGGFDWSDVYYLNNGKAPGPETGDEGFQDSIRGHGEASLGPGEGGLFESANLSESFSLKTMLASSGSSPGDPVIFTSYTYSHGVFTRKASDAVYLTPSVVKIDFAKLGGKGDFQNIAAVGMLIGSARYGHHYGHSTYGNGMVFDNLKVVWNGKIPAYPSAANDGHPGSPHIHHMVAASLSESGSGNCPGLSGAPDAQSIYHSALSSLDAVLGHPGAQLNLTSEFALPQAEHFGT